MTGVAGRALVRLLRGYQTYVSPAFPPTCRFTPTCSSYAIEALRVHGVVRGILLTSGRLLRCAPWHSAFPWHSSGEDPVPAPRSRSACPPRSARKEEQAPC